MIRPTLNLTSKRNYYLLKEILFKYNKKPKILCLGSGEIKGEGIDMLGLDIINVDITYSNNLDVVCNGEILPFKNNSFDAVILQAVLEHIKNYKDVIKEAHVVLKNGAYIYAEVPFIQGMHTENDYRRFTLDGIKLELNEFKEIKSGICVGPFSSFVWIAAMLLALIFSLNNRWLFNKLRLLFLYLISPLKYLDIFFSKTSGAEVIASAFYFLGRKI